MEITADQKMALLNRMKANSILLENRTSRVKGCIYGANGVGKTVLAVGMARKLIGPDKLIVFVDTNEGYESLRNHKSLMKNVLPIHYESVEQLYVIAESTYKGIAPFVNVGAIIFDDADFMAGQDLVHLWHKRVKEQPQSRLDPEKPERPEYLKLSFRFIEVMEFIFNQTPNIHLLMTAHDKEKKNKEGDTVLKIFPGFNPALASEIAGRLQFVVYMSAKEVKGGEKDKAQYLRTIQAHPSYLIDAKTRIGCEKIRYESKEFVDHVYQWVTEGRPEDPEALAVKREIETSKVTTELDDMFGGTEVDDDAPLVVE